MILRIVENGNYKEKVEKVIELSEQREDIKKESADLAKQIIERARQVQQEILRKTKEDVEKILIEAEKKAKKIEEEYKEKGYQDGYTAGYQEGYKKGEEDAKAIIEEAKTIKEEIIKEKQRMYKEAESDIVNVILLAVEKIVGKYVEEDKDIILNLIKKGMENYNAFDKVTVRVSEEDYEHCIKNKDKILKDIEFLDDVNILKDLSLKKGDCVIETNSGVINSGVSTQLKALKNLFAGVLNE
ncbi:Flagellar biosynthesis/type III secretory pathway protein-like protein [Thermoanaerobacter pseudethanolicus ATCC 33223]|uniref:Flagellar biosynthesis/type III secretory pathway protein-like protein n=1 Tax=Thermoanaerobacter pseudethanolicus (strain ATCC 33223 / 39E) TaxID=340099 RepID=B0K9U6_THEP3|nr:Flagellar biosynthesis/type III secretory pathway protein-like protein [Thermoanaerobacter sp. X514]ABY94909.1 Flagellar biosynthesis/type III secretory pathway protein-like protein [Thermoanaerobacter pseudethanolicus ATCC 33223]KUJ91465.1 MAG: flagellar biosynthesis/type III secretory pathway protein-like protein [Thermoanaerobacter thermocopriae]MDI3529117.1 flagellar assembly protein FliH [Thermoanaerobacter sp.]MDK2815022.1 flagellar assembly protein FliH [Thermoanaerobacter sp.]